MKHTVLRRARLAAPLLVLGLVVLLIVLDHRSSEGPPAAAPPAPAHEPAPPPSPPVLVGRPPTGRPRSSRLAAEDLLRLGTFRATAWDVARRVVAEGEVAVPFLLGALRSPDEKVRAGAHAGLLLVPDAASRGLADELGLRDEDERAWVLRALWDLRHWWAVEDVGAHVVPRIVDLLATGTDVEKQRAAELIAHAGRHAVLGLDAFLDRLRTVEGEALRDLARHATALERHERAVQAVLVDRLVDLVQGTLGDAPETGTLIDAIGRLGPPAPSDVERLAALVGELPADRRTALAMRFGRWPEAAAPFVPALAALLADEHAAWGALLALKRIPGGEMAVVRHLVLPTARAQPPGAIVLEGAKDRVEAYGIEDWGRRFEVVLPWLRETIRKGGDRARGRALRVLGFAPPAFAAQVAPLLVEAAASPDEATRVAAVRSITRRDHPFPGAFEVVVRALGDPSARVRQQALLWFRNHSEKSRDEAHAALVAPLLADPDDDVRFWAGNILKDIGTAPASAVAAAAANLNDDERLVRLGASRALAVLGPKAAEAVPAMIRATLDFDRDAFGLWPLAESGVFDERVKDAVRAYIHESRFGTGSVLRCFDERAAAFEPEMRAQFLQNPKCGELYMLAKVTRDPEGFQDWLLDHEARFDPDDVASALRSLNAVGFPALLRMARDEKRSRQVAPGLESAARALGDEVVPALLADLVTARGEDRVRVLSLLAQAAPGRAARTFAVELDADEAGVRRAAALGLAAAYGAGDGAATEHGDALVLRTRDDDPTVRDAAWQALRAGVEGTDALRARAEAALGDGSAAVRVAAAETVLAWGGDREKAVAELIAILEVPAPDWGWIGGGGTPARTEDDYDETEKLWVRAARALATLGEDAAPARTVLVWAALRHGEPRMQRILLGPIEAMGHEAEPVLPLLDRLAAHRGTWLGFHETVGEVEERLEAIYRPFERPVPQPDDDMWLD